MDIKWHYAEVNDDEGVRGQFNTREEAIAAARADLGTDVALRIFASRDADPCEFFDEPWRLFDSANEKALDEIGEWAEDWPELPKHQLEAFEIAYKELIHKYFPTVPFRVFEGKSEYLKAGEP